MIRRRVASSFDISTESAINYIALLINLKMEPKVERTINHLFSSLFFSVFLYTRCAMSRRNNNKLIWKTPYNPRLYYDVIQFLNERGKKLNRRKKKKKEFFFLDLKKLSRRLRKRIKIKIQSAI